MAMKTMLRQLISKWGIMSIDLQKATEGDMSVIKEDGTPDYVESANPDIEADHTEVSPENVAQPEQNEEPASSENQMSVEEAFFAQ